MKHIFLVFILLLIIVFSSGQSILEINYSKDICKCLDSLKLKTTISEDKFPLCFQLSIKKNTTLFIQECFRIYGDTTEQTGYKFGKELAEKLSISLVSSCKAYFIIADSLRYSDYMNLNKDSLRNQIKTLETVEITKRDKEYYDNRGLIYFQLAMYDKSLEDVEKVLSEDTANVKNIFTKAWISEIKGNYQDAFILYKKAAELSNIPSFYIFSEIAKRKKTGL